MLPPFLNLSNIFEYQDYYYENYCKKPVITHDNIPVYFKYNSFNHICYESSNRDGNKDIFSTARAKRLPWIRHTIESPKSILYQGWNKKSNTYDPTRRVAHLYENFVVIITIGMRKNGALKGNLLTCYDANNSIYKIRNSPLWDKEVCENILKNKKGR
ncbi:MAG: hypothetical protein FXF49_08385 [Flexistipes sinusarabici]|uniref:Uncharacterized protein n=1 Tax=Flexistipes sinusarabici TaxID=2352 RepID=A0A5D0MH48_FLESI|nr:hypothetical protein [Flexistipes sinusarabici]TYB33044.1 MAG: hypothetical protein FXF49_08385 [Flexistipes sinusarabici]